MKTKKEIRTNFWQFLQQIAPDLAQQKRTRKTQNDYCADIRCAFVQYIDDLLKSGQISEKLANDTTL